jgi:hypothetical protein
MIDNWLNKQPLKEQKNNILKYAGLGAQFMIGLSIFLFCGLKIDKWLRIQSPMAVWILPLLFITSAIIKIIIETGKKK